MSELYYLYCFAWADCSVENVDEAMDDRFPVERVSCPPISAVASRVGPDRFDLSKLQEETTDVNWLSQVAVRHNAIVDCIAQHHPILPLKLGTVFNSRSSLLTKTAQCAPEVAEFLRRLEDRQEWAVKLYLDEERAEEKFLQLDSTVTIAAGRLDAIEAAREPGTNYFVAKRQRERRRRQLQETVRDKLLTVESCLERLADSWRRLRPLSATLTGRSDKMVWNAAFLLSRSAQNSFRDACERLRNTLNPKGLTLEVTGPWAPYHFCPTLVC